MLENSPSKVAASAKPLLHKKSSLGINVIGVVQPCLKGISGSRLTQIKPPIAIVTDAGLDAVDVSGALTKALVAHERGWLSATTTAPIGRLVNRQLPQSPKCRGDRARVFKI